MAFQRFILKAVDISHRIPMNEKVRLCWIPRGSYSRVIRGEQDFIDQLRRKNPHIAFEIGDMGVGHLEPLRNQITWSQQCDVMVGAHGAGLTHSMWMAEESILIELWPPDKGSYRTLARAMGHQYLYVPLRDEHSADWIAVQDVVDAALHLAGNMRMRRASTGLNGE